MKLSYFSTCFLPLLGTLTVAAPVDNTLELAARQMTARCDYYQELVGEGDPHQDYFHKQISEVINCGAGTSYCVTGFQSSESFTISATIGIGTAWMSSGFGVSKEWTTGNNYECAGEPGKAVCVWYKTAHTAYTVKGRHSEACGFDTKWTNYVIQSPNNDNRGGGYYCVVGDACRSKGDGYWEYGPAGTA